MKVYNKNILNFILLVIICTGLYYSLVPNKYIKYSIVVIVLSYYAIVDIRYALVLLIAFIMIENNSKAKEHFATFDKEHRAKIFDTIDDSIVKISNVISEEQEEQSQEEEVEVDYDDMFKNEPKTFSEMIENRDGNEIEPFVDLNAITGTFLKVGETIHNNNNIDKIKKNIRRGVRNAMKTLQEEDEENDEYNYTSTEQESKIKKQNVQYKKEKKQITDDISSDNDEETESSDDEDIRDDESDKESNDGIEGFTTDMKEYMKVPKHKFKQKMMKKNKKKGNRMKKKSKINKKKIKKYSKGKFNIFEHLQNNKEKEEKIDELQGNIQKKIGQISNFLSQIKK